MIQQLVNRMYTPTEHTYMPSVGNKQPQRMRKVFDVQSAEVSVV